MKICTGCGIEKPRSEFYLRNRNKNHIHALCKVCSTLEQKKYIEKNRHKSYEYSLKRRYNLTIEEYTRLYHEQDGQCAICLDAYPTLSVDHDHVTGLVRGLLCQECNLALGKFRDSAELMQRAVDYIDLHRSLNG